MKKLLYFILLILMSLKGFSQELFCERSPDDALFYDLAIAQYWDEKMNEKLPITYNYLLETGYFVTPSARMNEGGEIGVGATYAPPYTYFNIRTQLFSHLEISTNYKIFNGVKDLKLSPYGYGDFTDRGANVKLALVTPEDSWNVFPGIAIGAQDFFGTSRFKTYYAVATKNWMNIGLETTLGWGNGRFKNDHSKGFFGGFAWFPFFQCQKSYLKGFAISAEYDPIDYSDPSKEPHPDGREKNAPINYGLKYKYLDYVDFSISHLRADALAISSSLTYNWGKTKGFLPKVDDPIPYCEPCEINGTDELIGCLTEAFLVQGFKINYMWLEQYIDPCFVERIRLRIQLNNLCYREEMEMRLRLNSLLAFIIPPNIDDVVVVIECLGLTCQQYQYSQEMLQCYAIKEIGNYEMQVLTPMRNASFPDKLDADLIYYSPPKICHFDLSPNFQTFLNNAKGKFKFNLGLRATMEGLLPNNFYYELGCSYIPFSTMGNIFDFDLYNPSQLPNVQTDYVRYRQKSAFTIDQAYMQKTWNFGKGVFGRLGAGYFEVMFGGFAGEMLFYPVNSNFAIGVEGALLKKRRYSGLGFLTTIRQLEGFTPVYRHYTVLDQYFLNLYFDYQLLNVNFKCSIGQFLARDKGVRFEATRYFESGMRLTGWYTVTNAGDMVNETVYHDKGFSLQMPLDFFFKCRSRRVWNYALAAWLRDAGAMSQTGRPLYEFINLERR